MLPFYGVFDNLEFTVDGGVVTLSGQASRPVLKSDAEGVIKKIEGVTTVRNEIEVLPLSPNDDHIRAAVYTRLYRTPALQKYTSNRTEPILRHGFSGRRGGPCQQAVLNWKFSVLDATVGLFPKLNVAGSNPVSRFIKSIIYRE
jgi:hypothetical protein